MKRLVLWIVVIAAVGAGGYWGYRLWSERSQSGAPTFRTAPVQRRDVVWSISATGTVVPEDVVDVGTQVNGLIASFGVGTDGKPVDYRSNVKADSVLAKIDDAIYSAQVAADEASLNQAQAAVRVAEATRAQAQARLEQARRDWERAQKLGESQALSQVDYDSSKSNFEQAEAGLALAEAQIGQAKSQVASAQAALVRSRRNLFYCTIVSPVDGVIIDRRVDIGQTVVSSLNAPSLFLIAKDLTRMQVLVQVNEADIGHVRPGETVSFTCDAFPGERFAGEVRKVRLNATMTQNVVTYTVEIVTDNSSMKLLPYLTANVQFTLGREDDALSVPNAALRWSPTPSSAAASASGSGAVSRGAGQGRGDAQSSRTGDARGTKSPGGERDSGGRGARVWVLREGVPVAASVKLGISDGTSTAVESDELREGDEVIVGEAVASGGTGQQSTNPFAPQMFRGGGRPGGGGR